MKHDSHFVEKFEAKSFSILLTLIKHISGRTAAQNYLFQEFCVSHHNLRLLRVFKIIKVNISVTIIFSL